MPKYAYGWRPQYPDHRDHLHVPRPLTLSNLPTSVDLRSQMPAVWDQDQIGTCGAHATGAAWVNLCRRQGLPEIMPSRLFIYYNARVYDGTQGYDSGISIRNGIKALATSGVCPETDWGYDETKYAVQPPAVCYADGAQHRVLEYQSVGQDVDSICAALAEGDPVIIGISVYSGFESGQVAASGQANLPQPEETFVGGHAVLIVGYDRTTQRFLLRNSWSANWGLGGYFTLPFSYVANPDLASDFWIIKSLTAIETPVVPEQV